MHGTAQEGREAGNNRNDAALQVVIISEDWEAGQHAARLYARLERRLADECGFEPHPWDFEALSEPRLQALAAREAARADVVILALQGERALPPEVREWLQLWMMVAGDNQALAVMFAAPHAASRASIVRELQALTRNKHVELFIEPDRGSSGAPRKQFARHASAGAPAALG